MNERYIKEIADDIKGLCEEHDLKDTMQAAMDYFFHVDYPITIEYQNAVLVALGHQPTIKPDARHDHCVNEYMQDLSDDYRSMYGYSP